MKLPKEVRLQSIAHEDYIKRFTSHFNQMMEGLLEPYGDNLKQFGPYQTKEGFKRLILAFRELLEIIEPRKDFYFDGKNFPERGIQPAIDKSSRLLKGEYLKKINSVSTEGYADIWTIVYNKKDAKFHRERLFNAIKEEFRTDAALKAHK